MSELSAQNGDTISVHYLGKFPGGKVFDTSMKAEAEKAGIFSPARDYKPLQVILGAHQVIDRDQPLVGLLLAGDHAKQRRLAGPVRTDHADDLAFLYGEVEVGNDP